MLKTYYIASDMDSISQLIIGGGFSQASESRASYIKKATLVGFFAGTAPDFDVFFRSATDPMFGYLYHRHFTHSLVFIPIGALLCALFLWVFAKKYMSFKDLYKFSFFGYASHAILDACTSYGTMLLWPFSYKRIAWNSISIIDPLFTFPLIIFVALAYFKKNNKWAKIGLAYCCVYMMLGLFQHQRAKEVTIKQAIVRGHSPARVTAKPSLGNIILWRTMYQHKDKVYVDAARIALKTKVIKGSSAKLFVLDRDASHLPKDSLQYRDIKIFSWFSDQWVSVSEDGVLIDMRYSVLPNSTTGLWGMRLFLDKPGSHVEHVSLRSDREKNAFFNMLLGKTK